MTDGEVRRSPGRWRQAAAPLVNRWNEPGAAARDAGAALLAAALVWVLLVFEVVPEGFDYAAIEDTGMPSRGSLTSRAVWLALLGLGLFVVVSRHALARLLARWLNPFLLALALLACASVAWSIDPNLTVRRLVRLAAVLACAAAFALPGWHPRRFQAVVRPVLTLMIAASLAVGALLPEIGVMSSTTQAEIIGAWRGIATQKNGLGALASLATLFWLHAFLARDARPLVALAGLAASATCLVLTRSSTSMLATGLVAAFLVAVLRYPGGTRRAAPWLALGLAAMLALYSLAVLRVVPGTGLLLEPITALTGKDLTFTGRTELWEIIRERIAMRPLLGGGFGAYWGGPVPWSPSYEFVTRLNFYPTQSHNGYLEVLNDLGYAGLACLVGYLVAYLVQALRLMRIDATQGVLYVALLLQQLVLNLSESRWWNVLSVDFAIMALATFALARDYVEARLRVVARLGAG